MLSWIKKIAVPLAAIGCLAFMAPFASADSIVPALLSVTPTGPNWVWTYQLDLTGGVGATSSTLKTGDFFILQDVEGLIGAPAIAAGGTTPSANWTIGTEATSANYVGGVPGSDSSTPNIRVTYSPAVTTDLASDSINMVRFSLVSSLANLGFTLDYSGNDHRTSDSSLQTNLGLVVGPSAVPLPPAVWAGLSLMGLMGVKGFRRQRLNKAAE